MLATEILNLLIVADISQTQFSSIISVQSKSPQFFFQQMQDEQDDPPDLLDSLDQEELNLVAVA
jgi:hypothetical protein